MSDDIFTAKERDTARYTAKVRDETGALIQDADLTELTLYLYDVASGTVIRNRQDVKNANGGTISNGDFVMIFTPTDNAIHNDGRRLELHIALFEYKYGTDKEGHHEVQIRVRNTPNRLTP